MSTINKVLTLAFHPATPEPEAITAFLKARQLKVTPESFINTVQVEKKLPSASCNVTIEVRKIPHLLTILNVWKEIHSTTNYTIKVVSDSWSAIGSIKLEIIVDTEDIDTFKSFLRKGFDKI